MKTFKFFACVILFFTCSVSNYAQLHLKRIFSFETDFITGYEQYIEYNDQYILPMDFTVLRYYLELGNHDSTLIPGETCMLKIYYDPIDTECVDSCFTTYNYVPESYEYDGFWIEADAGSIVVPGGNFGLYNIAEDVPYDVEDYPDLSDEEYQGIHALHGPCILSDDAFGTYLKVEIYVYRNY